MILLSSLFLFFSPLYSKCYGCSGPGCGVCAGDIAYPNSLRCNSLGTDYQHMWWHDGCGGCSQNNGWTIRGDYSSCSCNIGFAGSLCEKCDINNGYGGIWPNCKKCSKCDESHCGICGPDLTYQNSIRCNGLGTDFQHNWFQDDCGKCGGNTGWLQAFDFSPCSCNVGFFGEKCEKCDIKSGYGGSWPTCKKCTKCLGFECGVCGPDLIYLNSPRCSGQGTDFQHNWFQDDCNVCSENKGWTKAFDYSPCTCNFGFAGTVCEKCDIVNGFGGIWPNCKKCTQCLGSQCGACGPDISYQNSVRCNGLGTDFQHNWFQDDCGKCGGNTGWLQAFDFSPCSCNVGFFGEKCEKCDIRSGYGGSWPTCKKCTKCLGFECGECGPDLIYLNSPRCSGQGTDFQHNWFQDDCNVCSENKGWTKTFDYSPCTCNFGFAGTVCEKCDIINGFGGIWPNCKKCTQCLGPQCGVCGPDISYQNSIRCNGLGTDLQHNWFHDDCGKCGENKGWLQAFDFSPCTCNAAYSGEKCEKCNFENSYIGDWPDCGFCALDNCQTCKSISSCAICVSGYILQNETKCIHCENSTHFILNNSCWIRCNINFFMLENGTCLENCPIENFFPYYLSISFKTEEKLKMCGSCHSSCRKCSNDKIDACLIYNSKANALNEEINYGVIIGLPISAILIIILVISLSIHYCKRRRRILITFDNVDQNNLSKINQINKGKGNQENKDNSKIKIYAQKINENEAKSSLTDATFQMLKSQKHDAIIEEQKFEIKIKI